MTWVAWRVQRSQLIAATVAVFALAAWLFASGLAMGHHPTWKYWTIGATYLLYVLPGALGLALGSPLVASEIEHRTDRLAWSQSVTKTRWLIYKLAVGAVLTIVVTGLLTLLLEWWTSAVSISPFTNSGGVSGVRVQPETFDLTGLVVVGYSLFAFMLGAALGTVMRRPGWTFAIGVPVFAFARLATQQWVRPTLVSPATLSNLSGFNLRPVLNGWVLHMGILPIGRTSPLPGHAWSTDFPTRLSACLSAVKAQTQAASVRCSTLAHVHYVTQFQPASHYWPLQLAETAMFLAMAVALLAVTIGLIRRWSW